MSPVSYTLNVNSLSLSLNLLITTSKVFHFPYLRCHHSNRTTESTKSSIHTSHCRTCKFSNFFITLPNLPVFFCCIRFASNYPLFVCLLLSSFTPIYLSDKSQNFLILVIQSYYVFSYSFSCT